MELSLGPEFGTLSLSGKAAIIPDGWTVGPPQKAAGLRLHAGGPRRKLKELLREQGIPPWLRTAIPVLYWHGEAAAVENGLLSDELQDWLLQNEVTYTWRPNHPLLRKLQSVSVHFPDERNH
jgi:tRNA(Ile)-lysidine synthetase-like protein